MSSSYSSEYPILIVNWNGSSDTLECVESVLNTAEVDYNIIIWDNNSTQEEKKKLEEGCGIYDKVEIHWCSENIGFTAACNEMMSTILGQVVLPAYIILLNNDTVVEPDWLKKLTAIGLMTEAGIVSSRMIQYYNRQKLDQLGHQMLTSGEIIPIANNKSINTIGSAQNLGASAGASAYSVAMLKEIGLFDSFFNTGYEDAELGLRAFICGYKLEHSDEAKLYHKGGATISKVFDMNRAIREQISVLYTMWKCYPVSLLIIVIPITLVRTILIALVALLTFRFSIFKIILKSSSTFYSKYWTIALSKRNEIQRKKNSFQTFAIQKSTIIYDIKRVHNYLVLNRKSNLERYKSEL